MTPSRRYPRRPSRPQWMAEFDERRADRAKAGGPGYAAGGGYGAPAVSDAYGSRRSPSPWEMVATFKGITYACGHINAQAVAKQPLRLYVTTGSKQDRPKCLTRDPKRDARVRGRLKHLGANAAYGEWLAKADAVEEVAEHPLLAALSDPNKDFTQQEMIAYLSLSCDFFGAGYVYPDTEGGPLRPGSLWPLYGHMVRPTYGSASMSPDYFQYFDRRFAHDELIRVRRLSLRDPYGWGYGPAQAAIEYVMTEDENISTTRAAMGQAIRPSLFLTNEDADEPLAREQGERLADSINRRASGGNAGRAIWMDGAIKLIPWSPDVKSLIETSLSVASCKMIARCFGVPWAKLETEDVNRANADAAHRQHSEDAIEPLCVGIAGGLSRWTRAAGRGRTTPTGRSLGWERLFWAFDNPVTEDRIEQAKVFEMRRTGGSITINEERAEYGEEPVPWGDEPWLPGTLRQPSQIDEDRRQAAELARREAIQPQDSADSELEEAEEAADAGSDGPAEKGKMADPFPPRAGGADVAWANAHRMVNRAARTLGLSVAPDMPAADRLALVHQVGEHAAETLRRMADELIAALSPDEPAKAWGDAAKEAIGAFFRRAGRLIRTTVLAGSLALFGPDMPADAKEATAAQVARQDAYLANFRREVLSGGQKPDGTLAGRAAMYGRAAWLAAQNALVAVAKRRGMVAERRVLGPADHCEVCPAQAELGWQPLGALLPIGSTPCKTGCRCRFEFRDVHGNVFDIPPERLR